MEQFLLANFHCLLFLQVFNHVILSPHVLCYFWKCTGHYSYELTCRCHSYVAIFPQILSFSSAGCLRVQTVWLYQSSFSDSAPLKLSISFQWNCPLACYHVVLWGSNLKSGIFTMSSSSFCPQTPIRKPLARWSYGITAQPLSQPPGVSRCFQEKNGSTHAWAYLLGFYLFQMAILHCIFSFLLCPGRYCSHFHICSQQGVWLECPVLCCWKQRSSILQVQRLRPGIKNCP